MKLQASINKQFTAIDNQFKSLDKKYDLVIDKLSKIEETMVTRDHHETELQETRKQIIEGTNVLIKPIHKRLAAIELNMVTRREFRALKTQVEENKKLIKH